MDGALLSPSFIVINLLFAAVALGIGFVAGAWFFGGEESKETAEQEPEESQPTEQELANERVAFASSRLKDLASGMASDVGDHNSLVEQITADLNAARNAPAEQQNIEVTTAIAAIVDANEQLQAKLAKAEQQIQSQAAEIRAHESEARTDSLTQLANRRAFDAHLEQRFAEWKRKATAFSLVILDVDHFKKFNDTHGHQAGDEVLRQVARALGGSAREMDIPCRYGGEEFAVIVPDTPVQDARRLVERIRKSIETLQIKFEGKTLSVTASFGLAEIAAGDDAVNLLRRADDALYAAKDAGRNRGFINNGGENFPIELEEAALPASAKVTEVATSLLDKLPNRTLMAEELRRRIAESDRNGSPLSVIAIELPGFKHLQEEYGEAVALLTLDSLAQFLQNSLREMDLLGKLEEGQFMMMLPGANKAGAETVAERAALALAGCSVPLGNKQIQLTTSMGVAEHETHDTATSLMRRATLSMQLKAPQPASTT